MKNKKLKYLRNTLFYILIQSIRFLFFFIPLFLVRVIGKFIGITTFYLFKNIRNDIYKNLNIVYNNSISEKEKIKITKENLKNYGIGITEFIKFSVWPPEKIASLVKEVKGIEYFDKAKKEKRGLIGVTAHFSNWEIIPIYLSVRGYNIGVIGKRLFDDRIDKLVNLTRSKSGVKVFYKDSISKDLIKSLKNGMNVGVLVDQDTNVESEIIPFLGAPAKTPIVPAILAKKFNLYICTLFILRDKYQYKLIINKPYNIKNMSIKDIALKYNNEISNMILNHPEQWAWVHKRWKSINGVYNR